MYTARRCARVMWRLVVRGAREGSNLVPKTLAFGRIVADAFRGWQRPKPSEGRASVMGSQTTARALDRAGEVAQGSSGGMTWQSGSATISPAALFSTNCLYS